MAKATIHYFSDLLCVWAYIGQARVDQLVSDFSGEVALSTRTVTVFGNVGSKMERGWAERGGIEGYAAHVKKVLADYEHVTAHEELWTKNTPCSSLPAHLFLAAVRSLEGEEVAAQSAYRALCSLRIAFFQQARDVSRQEVHMEVAEELGLPVGKLESLLDSGLAHAALHDDMELQKKYDVAMSPTLVMNEGRQRLNGNVGYRLVEANVRELMHVRTLGEASWC